MNGHICFASPACQDSPQGSMHAYCPPHNLVVQIPLLAYAEQQHKCTMRPTQKWRMCNQSFLSNKCSSCH